MIVAMEVCKVSGAGGGNFVLFCLHLFELQPSQNFVYKTFWFLCLCQQLAAEGILFLAVQMSVFDHILKVCEPDILHTAFGNFTKFTTNAVVDRGDRIRF